jgi:transposase-like protein
MSKRKDSQEIQRLLRDADRDLARGLTVGDVCRKHGISANTYHRWRQRNWPLFPSREPFRNCSS